MKFAATQDTPIGPMTLVEEDGALTQALFGRAAPQDACLCQTSLLKTAFDQLQAYFAGRLRCFDVPLRPVGTAFQLRCWRALRHIPYGQTRTYAQQAQAVGHPRAFRAAGMANHRNPLPIFIPCHRVVGKNGALTGYAGGLTIKQHLLDLEKTEESI